jgi:sec-independent protein translocase protein TatA
MVMTCGTEPFGYSLEVEQRSLRLRLRANKENFMFDGLFQPTHLLVIFGIALLVFGPKKLPELGKGIGEGIRGFKAAMKAEDAKPAAALPTGADDQNPRKA